MLKWLWSRYYDKLMQDAEERCLRDWRRELLSQASGMVLELGAGTGVNIPYYPKNLEKLILLEPNLYMHEKIKKHIFQSKLNNTRVIQDTAEELPFESDRIDTIVMTLVLCSVKNINSVLNECSRVLKPTGQLIFIEHVAAHNRPERFRWQKRLEPIWKHIMDGCHVTRDTEKAIIHSGFKFKEINKQSMREVPPIARPSIRGIAIKC